MPYLKLRRCPHHLEAGHSSLPVGHGGHHHVGHGGGYVLKTKNTQNNVYIKNYFLLIRLNRRNEIREPINISFTYIEKLMLVIAYLIPSMVLAWSGAYLKSTIAQ